MISFDENSVGYNKTGGRFDWFAMAGYGVVVDTKNADRHNKVITGWITHDEAKQTANTLNTLGG